MNNVIFGYELRKNDFHEINLQEIPEFKKCNVFDLEYLDFITSHFTKEEFIDLLQNRYLIDINDCDFSIIFKTGGIHKVPNGVCFKEDSSFINARYIKKTLFDLLKDNDFYGRFINKFKNENKVIPRSNNFHYLFENIIKNKNFLINSEETDVLYLLEYSELREIGFFIKQELIKLENSEKKEKKLKTADKLLLNID